MKLFIVGLFLLFFVVLCCVAYLLFTAFINGSGGVSVDFLAFSPS